MIHEASSNKLNTFNGIYCWCYTVNGIFLTILSALSTSCCDAMVCQLSIYWHYAADNNRKTFGAVWFFNQGDGNLHDRLWEFLNEKEHVALHCVLLISSRLDRSIKYDEYLVCPMHKKVRLMSMDAWNDRWNGDYILQL